MNIGQSVENSQDQGRPRNHETVGSVNLFSRSSQASIAITALEHCPIPAVPMSLCYLLKIPGPCGGVPPDRIRAAGCWTAYKNDECPLQWRSAV